MSTFDINAKLLQLVKAKQSEGHDDDEALRLVWGDVFSWITDPKNSTKTFEKDLKRLFGVSMKTKIVDVEIWNGLLGEIKIKVEELQTAEQERIREKMEKKMTSEKKKPTIEDQVSFVPSSQEQPPVDLEDTFENLEEDYFSMVGHFDDELHLVTQEGSKKDVLNFLLGFRDGLSKNEKMNETKYYTQGYTKGMSMTAIAADDDDDWA
jgi:hypothetical protein